MKKRIHIKEIAAHIGATVTIAGFVQTIRNQGKIGFVIVRDITGTVQVVVIEQHLVAMLSGISTESVVRVVGKVKAEKQAPSGVEIEAEEIELLSHADPELPIPIVGKGFEETDQQIRLDWRWLDLRRPEKALIFKVWTVMEQAFRNYCIDSGYIEIHSPKITATATESGAELFKASLAQSPQLYKQMAMAAGLEKVFEVGPVFRANPSFTSRHDTEFTMYDIEMSYIGSHHDLMDEEERMVTEMLRAVKVKFGKEILELYGRDLVVPALPFPRLTLREVKKILAGLGIPNERGDDMSPEEERAISDYIKKEYGHEFVFIHEFPTSVRAFYSMRSETDPTVTKSFDLLWNGIEITSGAQREHRVEQLSKQIKEQGLDVESFKVYLDFFRYGCPPHGGFAPGPTRMLMKIFNIANVREVTYLYRGVKRLTP